MPSADDDFDRLLAADAGTPAPAPRAEPVHAHEVQRAPPSAADFAAGWHIYRDPVTCAAASGLVLGVLGVFVVLRRAVFVTAAVTQAAGLGVALAFLIELRSGLALPPVFSAFVLSLAATSLFLLRGQARLSREAVVGFIYLATSAVAVLVGDRISQEAHDIAAILFGTAVLVRPEDLRLVALVGGAVLVTLVFIGRGLVFSGFDAEGARVQRLPVQRLELGLWALVAAEVSVSTRALGALPVFAFAVLPATGALALAGGLRFALIAAGVAGAAAGVLGYVAAFFFELPVGASQASVAALLALLALGASRLRR